MQNNRKIELLVGFFILLGIAAVLVLALKVANGGVAGNGKTYTLYAKFDNVGGLKPRSPVKVGGVVVGRVEGIKLDASDFTPVVTMAIDSEYTDKFPETSSAAILTSGLLGEQYIGLHPGFKDDSVEMMKNGDYIEDTKSALVLEELIGQFLFGKSHED
ncbi:outer membrane lipid asymmetry maintenance protein MlaD [Gallaecimonas pentaromativorans]|uniref:Phospholipid/cholesterol/gamma-HCH transport system substrate-binding protein n=1 Tax=Gallaecimonas pentaromativorans TaxID=584787 RepID=A0A3N1PVL9_9GAMM|nr:outer membrane lipid asymmetry maintenance protein MlaD [Gallaecimonas pentaromativorans]MED5523610.1 outer membrane lipid asymmetry maintenance protein MlaD [Pseudomonadota bacterium]ROQ30800.1 phospholipid/cholesterol/gamma-HCH transport system substrate-binding protein [Gallaecimonas pentaromativorans]